MDREFPALRRRLNYLENEMYSYQKWLKNGDASQAEQFRQAADAVAVQEEAAEIGYVLRFFERQGSFGDWRMWQVVLMGASLMASIAMSALALLR
jgi:hypothetical protein